MTNRPATPAQTLAETLLAETLHELRSPLGGIEAMAELLAEGPLTPVQAEMVAALRASARHLRAIAGRVLGGNEVEAMPLGAVLDDFAQALAARCHARGLGFAVSLAVDLPADAPVDGCALRQVLENLADNAVRLTRAGRIALDVRREGDSRIRFELRDSGPGLSREDAARLIRAGGRIEGHAGGAGIGLSIAGRLVAARGGCLEGGPGEAGGAVFAFDWPPDIAERAGTAGGTAAEASGGLAPHAGAAGRVLVVDDHPAARRVLMTILGAAGYACSEAASVEEALESVAAAAFDAVMTDLNMPGGGGRRLIAALAVRPDRPRLIVVSGETPEAGLPVDGVVMKPVAVRTVLETVAGVLAATREAAA